MDISTGITIAMGVLSIVAIGWSFYSVKLAEKYRTKYAAAMESVVVSEQQPAPATIDPQVIARIQRHTLQRLLESGALVKSWAVGTLHMLDNDDDCSPMDTAQNGSNIFSEGVSSVHKGKGKGQSGQSKAEKAAARKAQAEADKAKAQTRQEAANRLEMI